MDVHGTLPPVLVGTRATTDATTPMARLAPQGRPAHGARSRSASPHSPARPGHDKRRC